MNYEGRRGAAAEDAPLGLGVGPCGGDLILDLGGGGEAEVGGALAGQVLALDLVEDVGGEDGAFDADGGEHGERMNYEG